MSRLLSMCRRPLANGPAAVFRTSPLSRHFNFGVDNWSEDTLKEIEAEWGRDGRLRKALPTPKQTGEKPFYVLSMFPYPSGKLHMGHVRVYAISDAIAHYHRMQGKHVIHPMGWDAFGLPAENAAIERGVKPKDWTVSNISAMRDQLDRLGCTFDWEREISTCHPSYYKWTQYLFLRLFRAGLAYRRQAMVNWDPVDNTVLADEQVDEEGRSWRSGAKVERRPLRQWFIRTTAFAKQLHDGLDDPSLINWRDITKMQRNWIGECNGISLDFKLSDSEEVLTSWTDQPENLHKVNYVALSEGHLLNRPELVERRVHSDELRCEVSVLSLEVQHPFDADAKIPVVILHSQDCFPSETCESFLCQGELAERASRELGLPQVQHSKAMSADEVISEAKRLGIGGHWVSAGLRDWLVSRQRYWGTPIPVVHSQECGVVPVSEDQLPVELPDLDQLSSKGASPLLQAEDWINTTCPKSGGPARRETDTMDTFVDSSWYFLRYLDPQNDRSPADPVKARALPVDIYIGGKEHATLHLYYARFFTHFLHSIGLSPVKEPFTRLIVQGMVKGQSYRVKGTGQYIPASQVQFPADGDKKSRPTDKVSGNPVVVEWEKMSKSKHNGVDPKDVLDKYGSDTVKMMILSGVGPASDRNWTEESYVRIRNVQVRLLKLVSLAVTLEKEDLPPYEEERMQQQKEKLWDARNYYLKSINHSYSHTHNLAIVLARIESLVKQIFSVPGQVKRDLPEYHRCLSTAIITLAPIAPHFAAELWRGFASIQRKLCPEEFQWDKSVFCQPWPQLDPDYALKLVVKAGDNTLAEIPVPLHEMPSLTEQRAVELASREAKVNSELIHPHTVTFHKMHDLFDATLEFTIDYPKLTEEEKAALKAQKEEKERLKQERRAKKMEERQRAEERKKIVSNTGSKKG